MVPAMRIWAFMSQRAFYVFGSLVLTTLIAAPAAHAVCRSPKNICKHIDDCLQRPDNEDAERIKEGVRTRNGKMVWAGAECKVPAVPVNLQSVSNEVIE
jgi:hypothetical protein